MSDNSLSPQRADELLFAVVTDDESRQDPGATYAQFHEALPIWDSGFGFTALARHADGLEVLRSPQWGRAEADMDRGNRINGGAPVGANGDSRSMLLLNPPDHTRLRALVSREFTPKRVESLRTRIKALLDPILDELEEQGGGDIMSLLATPFPVAVISELLGVPQQTDPEFLQLVRDITTLIDAAADDEGSERGLNAVMKLAQFFVELAEDKKTNPDDALLSALIGVESEGDRLTGEELIANVILLYAAGFETTSNLIGNGLLALLEHPEELTKLRSQPGLMPSAIWEMLRYDSPVQLNARFALTDTSFGGRSVGRGHQTIILQGAANHDPAVYDEPQKFKVDRFVSSSTAAPLSFGYGAHHCLGAHLARAEGEIVFSELLGRFSEIEIVGDRPRFRASFTLRGLDDLVVSVR